MPIVKAKVEKYNNDLKGVVSYNNKDYTLEDNIVLQKYWEPRFQTKGFINKKLRDELVQKGLISRTKDKNGRSFNIKTKRI